jgi:very-short-patch-repair endonuclease/DNA polymerase III delta prime subunit
MGRIADQLDEARRNELLDLTLRNPLISYSRLKSVGVEVIDERPVHVFRLLVEEGRKMSFLEMSEEEQQQLNEKGDPELVFGQPDESPEEGGEAEAASDGPADRHVDTKLQTPYTSEELQGRLLKSHHRARRSLEEEGVNTLYLALGMLRWYRSPSSDEDRQAPILLVPVELSRTDVQGRFRIEYLGEEIGGNLSLKAFLDREFGIEWPLPPDPEEEEEIDLQRYSRKVQEAIRGKERWHVDRTAVELGFFSFSRFLMYEDLDVENWPEGQRPDDHPVLARLLDEGFDAPAVSFSEEENLDKHLDPEDTHHVVEADSSQTEAILAVKQGQSLVLQGPPGTGKSQTITNVIAEAIADGKTVLFASEKMAALEVVKRNLDDVGLGDACLELHSHKTRKQAVLDELERTLNLGRPKVEDFSEKASVLVDARNRLNTYADAVNEPIGESGVRPYDAYGRLERLRGRLEGAGAPSLDVEGMRAWTGQEHEEKRFLVEQVESHLGEMGVPERHPFWGSRKTRFLPRETETIADAARQAEEALGALADAARALARRLELDPPEAPEDTRRLLRAAEWAREAPDLTGMDVRSDAWSLHATALQDLADAGARLKALHDEYDDVLIPEAWDADVLGIRQALAKHGGTWYRWIFSEWRQAKGDLAGLCRAELPASSEARVDLADAILEARRLEETLAENEALAAEAFGEAWPAAASGPERADWGRLVDAADYLSGLHAEIADGALDEGLLEAVTGGTDAGEIQRLADEVRGRRERLGEAASSLAEAIDLDAEVRFGASAGASADEARVGAQAYDAQAGLYEACREEAPRIQQMVTYNQLADELREAGLGAVERAARRWDEAPDHLVDAFERAYYNALLERAMDERPALERFSGAQHEQVAERFRALDEASLEHNRHELALQHYEGLPRRKGVGQMGTLLNEMGKKSRHMPIRRLMERAGDAVQAIKPVFMMSPMSVPKYLSPDSVTFDLVVFDEASQVRPVDAFGAILRGDQTVVVGDNKQLPPTSFFDASAEPDTDDYERRASDQESILDLFLSRGAPEQMLRFHYRSRDESLIAVSNKEFYDNTLNVFPSPEAERSDTGLVYNQLPDTTYDRGASRKNKGEAEEVARRVMEHARTHPEMSLGVATFSSAQQEAVRDRLEYERRQDPSCESFFSGHPSEPFFVKNLESVQGDQRDVIFISVGYGRDGDGKLSMNFGPLNETGGERRLNVLTTRAKYRCEVFTNLKADDLDLTRTSARGVEVLKEYLKFAETGELGVATASERGPDSPFEEAVAERIRRQGYEVVHQVGVAGFYIDLAVKDPDRPGRYLLGIECDGATYHSAKMARVRDRTRQAVLESLGWRIHRIWSTDWFRNPNDQLAKALTAIRRAQAESRARKDDEEKEQAPESSPSEAEGDSEARSTESGRANPRNPEPTTASTESPPAEMQNEDSSSAVNGEEGGGVPSGNRDARGNGDASSDDAPGDGGTTIERVQEAPDQDEARPSYEVASPTVSTSGSLHDTSRRQIGAWVREVVETESPVHEAVVLRRVLSASDTSRMGRRIREALKEGVEEAERRGWIERRGPILRDPGQETVPVRDRGDLDGPARDIEHVPKAEIIRAVREIADGAFGVGRGELVQAVARRLGFGRLGSNIRSRLEGVIDGMVQSGILREKGGDLVLD